MDIGLFLVIMIVMYVVPEILKRVKPRKKYQYPDFPADLPAGGDGPAGMPGQLSQGTKPPPLPIISEEGTRGDEGDPAWRSPAEPTAVMLSDVSVPGRNWELGPIAQGVVWAELIAPPVSLRMRRQGGRRI